MFNNIKDILKKILPLSIVNYFKRYLVYFPFERAHLNNGEVKEKFNFNTRKYTSVCIFSHFDKDDMIDDYVLYYLEKLFEQGIDIVFVSTAEGLTKAEIDKVSSYCMVAVVKENIGYDFGAWQTGITLLGKELEDYDTLVLCNDSVYAPICPLEEMFQQMHNYYDFWGITDSYEISHHIQSYFMVFNKKVINSSVFKDFWNTYKVYKIKRNIILNYEIGLSKKLLHKRFSMGAYCSYQDLEVDLIRNVTHYFWKILIEKFRCPILKVELLRDNPKEIDITSWKKVIEDYSSYDISLIENHLIRFSTSS